MNTRACLQSIMPSRDIVDAFVNRPGRSKEVRYKPGLTFDPVLGWVLRNSVRQDGIDNSKTFYHYESDGARSCIASSDQPCRIHTYGNSFTHCDQISDGKTWQEFLAAHLCEPVRNYGIDGYSVYQAYRRMQLVEAKHPADYLILNIYDDDHICNLNAWREIRKKGRGTRTMPYLSVNVQADTVTEHANPFDCETEVYRLCDEEFVYQHFQNDLMLYTLMAKSSDPDDARQLVSSISERVGIKHKHDNNYLKLSHTIDSIILEAALFSTRKAVGDAERFANDWGIKLMILLSLGRQRLKDDLMRRPRFDQVLLDWMRTRNTLSVIDLRDAFSNEFKQMNIGIDEFLDRFYIGHHNPDGNFFIANAIKDAIFYWLEPRGRPCQ